MALNSATLKAAIKPDLEQKMRTYILAGDMTPYPELTNFCEAVAESLANKIVDHIKTNAELDNATCSGTGLVSGPTCTWSNQPVIGGIK